MKTSSKMLLLVFILFSTHPVQPVSLIRAEITWTVDDNGPADFGTIQEAINSANPGDTVYVNNGTYYEHVIIKKSLSLIGENRNATIIDGYGTGTIIRITADNVSLSGFTIKNSELDGPLFYSSGILLLSSFSTVSDNTIIATQAGIYLYGAADNIIERNSVTNSSFYGALLDYSDGNVISDNIVARGGFGIGLDTSSGNTLSGNNISNNAWYGIYIYSFQDGPCDNNTVIDNRIADNAGGVNFAYSKGNTLSGNMISTNTGSGLSLFSSSASNISGNIIKDNLNGIYLAQYSDSNTVTNNLVSSNEVAVGLHNSENNTVYHNNFLNNSILLGEPYPLTNFWDDGYPSGGNYWSDYAGDDFYSGPDQNLNGSDGIGDQPYVIEASNRDRYPLMKPWNLPIRFHDVALLSAATSEIEVYVGQVVLVTIVVKNEGTFTETFPVNLIYEVEEVEHLIGTIIVNALPPLAETTISFSWTTTQVVKHPLKAHIPTITDEIDTHDNMLIVGMVKVKMVGDVNGDGDINIKDLAQAASAFGSNPTHPRWNSQADIDRDNKVDILDLALIAKNFGKTSP